MRKKIAVAFLASLLLNLLLAVPIHANSAQRYWSGTDSTGALVKDKNCPLVVDKELLTFDVQGFPKNYYTVSKNTSPIQERSRLSTPSATPPTIR